MSFYQLGDTSMSYDPFCSVDVRAYWRGNVEVYNKNAILNLFWKKHKPQVNTGHYRPIMYFQQKLT